MGFLSPQKRGIFACFPTYYRGLVSHGQSCTLHRSQNPVRGRRPYTQVRTSIDHMAGIMIVGTPSLRRSTRILYQPDETEYNGSLRGAGCRYQNTCLALRLYMRAKTPQYHVVCTWRISNL